MPLSIRGATFIGYFKHGDPTHPLRAEFTHISAHEAFFVSHAHINMRLSPDPALISAFESLDRAQTQCVILTQSSAEFLDRHLRLLELDQFFSRSARIAFEDYNLESKKASSRGFITAKKRAEHVFGVKYVPQDITMLEDSPDNLRIPHQMGWDTGLVHYGKMSKADSPENPAYIRRYMHSPADLLREMPQKPAACLGYSAVDAPRI